MSQVTDTANTFLTQRNITEESFDTKETYDWYVRQVTELVCVLLRLPVKEARDMARLCGWDIKEFNMLVTLVLEGD